jgi:hypothetical protein
MHADLKSLQESFRLLIGSCWSNRRWIDENIAEVQQGRDIAMAFCMEITTDSAILKK